MPSARERLKKIAERVEKGVAPPRETVRTFLGWFGAERRGFNIVWNIRHTLAQAGLETHPDFEYAYIDGRVSFVAAGTVARPPDPTYRIGRLESANRTPDSVKPDNPLAKATTLMLSLDYSQVPVMTNEREVKGIVSWKSIGSRLALGKKCIRVRQCMETAEIIGIDTSLFSAIDIIAEHDYVLVRDNDQTIKGIVTASDLSQQFRQLAEPFLLIGEIENYVRRLIHGKFTLDELRDVRGDDVQNRPVEGVTDLTFGEYVGLLENDARWKK